MIVTRFRCVVCGLLTAGRMPVDDGELGARRGLPGDGSARYPRRHDVKGERCPGSRRDADWVDVEIPDGAGPYERRRLLSGRVTNSNDKSERSSSAGRGGARFGAGRPRSYGDNAERQLFYRYRQDARS